MDRRPGRTAAMDSPVSLGREERTKGPASASIGMTSIAVGPLFNRRANDDKTTNTA
jgi:hypothetical protein